VKNKVLEMAVQLHDNKREDDDIVQQKNWLEENIFMLI
jgi:hypothetical protein